MVPELPEVPELAPAADLADYEEEDFALPVPEDPEAPTARETLAMCLALLTALGVAAAQGLWHRARQRRALADKARGSAEKSAGHGSGSSSSGRKGTAGSTGSALRSPGHSAGGRTSGKPKGGAHGGAKGSKRGGGAAGGGSGRPGSASTRKAAGGRKTAPSGGKTAPKEKAGKGGTGPRSRRGGDTARPGGKASTPKGGTAQGALVPKAGRGGKTTRADHAKTGRGKPRRANGSRGPQETTTPKNAPVPRPRGRDGRARHARARGEHQTRTGAPKPPPRFGDMPGFGDMRPPPAGDRTVRVTVERVDQPGRPERREPAALPMPTLALPAGGSPAADTDADAGTVPTQTSMPQVSMPQLEQAPRQEQEGGAPVVPTKPSTQYADAELTIYDVIDADADMAEEITEGAAEARATADGCEQLLTKLEAVHAKIVELRVPGVLEGMLQRLMDKTGAVRARALAIAANLPAASEAISVAGSNAAARHQHPADVTRDMGHTRPAERDYHND
jgi:hypothetical protein